MQITEADIQAIQEGSKLYADALGSNDTAGAMAQFTEDAVRYPPNQETVVGRAAMAQWVDALPKRKMFRTQPQDIQGYDDLAYARGTYNQEMIINGVPNPVPDSGTYLEIWRKLSDGKWYISAVSHNSDNYELISAFMAARNNAG